MNIVELNKKVREFKETRSIKTAFEICDALVQSLEKEGKNVRN